MKALIAIAALAGCGSDPPLHCYDNPTLGQTKGEICEPDCLFAPGEPATFSVQGCDATSSVGSAYCPVTYLFPRGSGYVDGCCMRDHGGTWRFLLCGGQ